MEKTILNENQEKAVTLPPGPSMIIAGPGSGKTFVITKRIQYLINHLKVPSHHILVITFTKAAAEEMKKRFLNEYGNSGVTFGTFHSIFYRILRTSNPSLYQLEHLISEDKQRQLIEKIYRSLETTEPFEDFVETFLSHYTLMKNHLIEPKHYNPDSLPKELYQEVLRLYELYKDRHELFDFDDMLVHCYHLLLHDENLLSFYQSRYREILIDEFQDINCVQFEIIKLLAGERKHLFVVGDDDQSIYEFRGARPEFLLSFEDYFKPVKKVILDINYRSTEKILSYSNSLIGYNKIRYEKQMQTLNDKGELPKLIYCEDAKEEAHLIVKDILNLRSLQIPLSECAIIYRTNMQARPIIEALRIAQVPFIIKDAMTTLYDQWVTKDLLAYLHLAYRGIEEDKIIQVMNRPNRYIGKATLQGLKGQKPFLEALLKDEKLNSWQKDAVHELVFHLQRLKTMTLPDAIRYIRQVVGYEKYMQEYAQYRNIPVDGLLMLLQEIEDSAKEYETLEKWEEALYALSMSVKQSSQNKGHDAIILTTMHSAKGLEFENVFVIDLQDGIIPHAKSSNEAQIEEERRLLYVALTRAKQNLSLYIPKSRYQKKVESSPFILEILTPKIKLNEGDMVKHKMYGRGIVQKVEDTKATVSFKSGVKVIDYVFCLKNRIVTREENHVKE